MSKEKKEKSFLLLNYYDVPCVSWRLIVAFHLLEANEYRITFDGRLIELPADWRDRKPGQPTDQSVIDCVDIRSLSIINGNMDASAFFSFFFFFIWRIRFFFFLFFSLFEGFHGEGGMWMSRFRCRRRHSPSPVTCRRIGFIPFVSLKASNVYLIGRH